MKVKELIEKLQQLNQDDDVYIFGTKDDNGDGSINTNSGEIRNYDVGESSE